MTFYAAECGVYQGRGLVACAQLARASGLNIKIIGLDSFSGLPELGEADRELAPKQAAYLSRQLFGDTSLGEVQSLVESEGLGNFVDLVPGLFKDSLGTLENRSYFFVNIDCDLYEPHLECLEYFYPRMMPGGILFFDDYHSVEFPMARKAIDRFLSSTDETLFHLSFGDDGPNMTKAFIVKS